MVKYSLIKMGEDDMEQELIVKPILVYSVVKRKERTSWRGWGKILSEEDAKEERDRINKELAESLYVGLLTDTGSFSFSINSDKPYIIAAFLYNTGIDIQAINQRIYSAFTEGRLRLTGYAISEKLVVNNELRFAYISLTKEDLNRFDHQNGDTEGLVNYALGIENIVAAALLTEKDDKIRLSFRSKSSFAVNKIANEYFEGGGHKNAAGGNSFLSMQETIEKLNKIITQYKSEINAVQL